MIWTTVECGQLSLNLILKQAYLYWKKEKEDEYIDDECDDYYDPCCDPKYQDLCEDDYYSEDYFGYDEDEDECDEE